MIQGMLSFRFIMCVKKKKEGSIRHMHLYCYSCLTNEVLQVLFTPSVPKKLTFDTNLDYLAY
jgi:hypothetical protein